jgi:hypothetical protein
MLKKEKSLTEKVIREHKNLAKSATDEDIFFPRNLCRKEQFVKRYTKYVQNTLTYNGARKGNSKRKKSEH